MGIDMRQGASPSVPKKQPKIHEGIPNRETLVREGLSSQTLNWLSELVEVVCETTEEGQNVVYPTRYGYSTMQGLPCPWFLVVTKQGPVYGGPDLSELLNWIFLQIANPQESS